MTKLKEKREAQNLSQSQLAKKSDVSVRVIQNYECGKRNINNAQALIVWKLAEALNCKVGDILEHEEQ